MTKRMFALLPVLGASLLLLLGYLLLMPVGTLYAAPQATEWQVDRLDDPALPNATACTGATNDCSLRGAVDQAASGDTIVIAEAGTIQLGSQIVLTKNLTITSASATTHIIDGNDSTRLFLINAGQTINLDELTLQNGHSSGEDDEGGAISMAHGTLTMTHVILQNNVADGVGGALSIIPRNGTANVHLTDVTFRGNHAVDDFQSGGAIHAFAPENRTLNLTIQNGLFESNEGGVVSESERDGYGGAISATTLDGGSTLNLDIRNTDFISNVSQYSGAIYMNSYARGGGSSSVHGLIYDSTFTENVSDYGGGIYLGTLDGGSHATLVISNTTFMTNSATDNGGALYVDNYNRGDAPPITSRTTIYNSTFSNNQAGSSGGAIRMRGSANSGSTSSLTSLELVNSTMSGNRSDDSGGAIYASSSGIITTSSFVTATNVTFFDNADAGQSDILLSQGSGTTNQLYLKNSLIGGGAGSACVPDGATVIGANNLIKDTTCGNSSPFRLGAPTGIVPTLADNGGQTLTHNLYDNSSALDAIPAGQCTVGDSGTTLTTDQRGETRPFGAACDIGAVEAQSNSLPSQPPVAGLSASNNGPTVVNNSTTLSASITGGEGVAYAWDFGDGSTGTGATPTHTYTQTGVYTASVVASNANNSMEATTTVDVVDQSAAPLAGLSASNDGPTVLSNATDFDADVTDGTPDSYAWDFGDGNDGSGASPSHTYAASGVYTATVVATNETNSMTATTTVYVGDAVVEVFNNFYSPAEVTIPEGGKVVWVLREGNHSVTANDMSFEQPAGTNWPPFIHTFNVANRAASDAATDTTIAYHCSVHGQSMAGTVIVEGDAVPSGAELLLPNVVKE